MYHQSRLLQLTSSILSAFILIGCDASQVGNNDDNILPAVLSAALSSNDPGTCEPIQIDISGTILDGKAGLTNSTPLIQLENPLPIGEYRITLHSRDRAHRDPDQEDQLNEQWYAELLDEIGNTVLTTPESADLPQDKVRNTTDVSSHDIATEIHAIRGVHAFESNKYNSVQPTMIELLSVGGCSSDPEDIAPPATTLTSYIPTDKSRLLAFDGINDNRIFRILTEDGFVLTTYGAKSNDGYVQELLGLTVENEVGNFLKVDLDSATGNVVLQAEGATYRFFSNDVSEFIYRIEVEEQYVEYVLKDSSVSGNTLPLFPQSRSANIFEVPMRQTRMNIASIPSADINVTGCTDEIATMSVRAFDRRGALLNQFLTTYPATKGGKENVFDVPLPGLSSFDDRLADFAEDMIQWLNEYTFSEPVEYGKKIGLASAPGVVDNLLTRGISEATDKIEDLLDDRSFFDELIGSPVVGSIPSKLKRVALRGLKAFTRYADIQQTFKEAALLGEATGSVIDLASSVVHDEVSFEVHVKTIDGEVIQSIRTDAVSPNGPFPDLTIEVPCPVLQASLGGGSFSGFFDPGKPQQNQFVPPIPACKGGAATGSLSGVTASIDMNTGIGSISYTAVLGYREDLCLYNWIDPGNSFDLGLSGTPSDSGKSGTFTGSGAGWRWTVNVANNTITSASFVLAFSFEGATGRYTGSL